MWPFTGKVPAEESMKWRKRGTLRTEPRSTTATVRREATPNEALLAIKSK